MGREYEGIVWDTKNSLYFDLADGYLSVHIFKKLKYAHNI